MPQLSPLNWMFLFSLFWLLIMINSSIMWWNMKNKYLMIQKKNIKKHMKYNW
uniref:ATP synthase F0 subunit 8 n=1 Tax=Bathypolypus sponsalis TaxID=102865 RepID=UPI0022DCDF02|nr:ATP synthase F0 subunit 8 [Bathypolypus sponsalis]UXN83955.1 ATP synthase F0 subunit 8 [Bathypolypus sponsalis]